MSQLQPPAIVRYRVPKPRITNRVNTNEYGLKIPSRQVVNYEPGINDHAPLFNISSGFNYRVEAKRKMNETWATYLAERKEAKEAKEAKATSENNQTNAHKNSTGKQLFGGRKSTRSKARRSKATRSKATRSKATRSKATRSKATRSKATRSKATRSKATRS